MMPCEPWHRLSEGRLTALWQAAEAHLPCVDAELAMEAVARGLGFRSYAALVAGLSIEANRPVNGPAAADFLAEHGVERTPCYFITC
jgi:hypothetical protein